MVIYIEFEIQYNYNIAKSIHLNYMKFTQSLELCKHYTLHRQLRLTLNRFYGNNKFDDSKDTISEAIYPEQKIAIRVKLGTKHVVTQRYATSKQIFILAKPIVCRSKKHYFGSNSH